MILGCKRALLLGTNKERSTNSKCCLDVFAQVHRACIEHVRVSGAQQSNTSFT